ncbi:glucose sorbosone dehydrogenase [Aeromicrobium sp. Root344]|uniref:PQQ-dependent sugar dehydrogenase n=1 Tax=Aeromicrobium sp. Root344 TaxID=1736521 RepID=UPI0006FBA5D9|nr:PQQ-dependent sugar dehydrogenase [Aeromicrobium sp. Root344]KQV76796.1 glucose sorbosone dehydrogenase [Aeromicrobium sp. Root344]
MERRSLLTGLAAIGAATLVGCGSDGEKPSPTRTPTARPTTTATPTSVAPKIASTIASGLNVPWDIVFLESGDALVSQRDEGSIVRISTSGEVSKVGDVAGATGGAGGEGGLLGLALAPDDESTLFAFVTTDTDNRVVRLTLKGGSIASQKPILTGIAIGARHHGGRLLFDGDGNLFVSTGDAGDGALAQDRDSLNGKVLRITRDGKAAADNPFDNRTWSYGHRNIEGLAYDADGRLWATEFGDKAKDELNLIEPGSNYGWPEVEGTSENDDLVNPKVTWGTDECSPAGVTITRSTAFLGALQGECMFAVPLDGTEAGKPKAYFSGDHGRIRTIVTAPDGALWVTTSNTDGRGDLRDRDDRILRVTL